MIAVFVADKMSRYLAGVMGADTAADFTRGELLAIYEGNHYSREESGAMRPTPPPEDLDPETAMKKCDAVIDELLKICAEGAGKGALLKEKLVSVETPEAPLKAQETESGTNKGNGLDTLKNYVKRKTA